MFRRLLILSALLLPLIPMPTQAATLVDRLKGFVLLQVQEHGEAWYVHPDIGNVYYLKDGPAAFNIMRSFGLGISNTDLDRLLSGRDASIRTRLQGRIVLKVQAHGEAYYVCPRTGVITYMKDGAAAYQVMRLCGLGITNTDFYQFVSAAPIPIPLPTPVPSPTPTPPTGSVSTIAGCSIFPADNPWNQDVSKLAVHPLSSTYITSIGMSKTLHPDFGENQDYGIPFNVVSGSQPKVPITFTAYGDESDPGPYPIPPNAKVEASSDGHLLVLEKDSCTLYEMYVAQKTYQGWSADSAAVWHLNSNALRPIGWTSADAAGLPILPGLVRYDEVAAGEIKHAIRFTASQTQNAFIRPASHVAGSNNQAYPPMGLRVRLKASYDVSHLTGQALVIATAMKKYGMILADNGSSWFFTGATDPGWNDDQLSQLKSIPGSAFEAVDTGPTEKP